MPVVRLPNYKERGVMPLIKLIRHGQVTLPAKFRDALKLKEGDYLEAEIKNNSIVLKPAVILQREQAIKGLHKLMDEVQSQNKDYSQAEVEQDVQEAIKAVRNQKP